MNAEKESESVDEKSVLQQNKQRLMDALRTRAVTNVTVNYEGSGDSGGITDVTFTPAVDVNASDEDEAKVTLLQLRTHYDGKEMRHTVEEVSLELEDALEHFAFAILSAFHSGWEINDGSSGWIDISVETGEVSVTHDDYYVASERTNTTL